MDRRKMLQFIIKIAISVAIIVFCSQIGRKLPTLAGLIATMPITSLIVLLWLWYDNPTEQGLMIEYAKGALWGIIPSAFFFLVAWFCFQKRLHISIVLGLSFAVWVAAAFVHQWLLGRQG